MDKGVLYFQNVRPDLDFMNEVFGFDARELPNLSSAVISQYCVALSQYVIFMKSQINKTLNEINMKQRFIDNIVNMTITANLIKKYKSKAATVDYIISSTPSLSQEQDKISELKSELILLDGQDKNILELINVFKRELTRRDNEIYSSKMERR